MQYSTKDKTIKQVKEETRDILKKHEVKPKGKLFYIKKYNDCTAIIEKKTTGRLYVSCLYTVYGSFKDIQACFDFRKIINLHNNAHRQAEVNAW